MTGAYDSGATKAISRRRLGRWWIQTSLPRRSLRRRKTSRSRSACDTCKRDHLQVEPDEIGCRVSLVNYPQGSADAGSPLWMPTSVEVTERRS